MPSSAIVSHLGEALAAINRAILTGTEGNLRFFSTGCANRCEHFLVLPQIVLPGRTALLTSLRLILKAFFRIKFLLAGSEYELVPTVLAYQSLVLIHDRLPRLDKILPVGRIRRTPPKKRTSLYSAASAAWETSPPYGPGKGCTLTYDRTDYMYGSRPRRDESPPLSIRSLHPRLLRHKPMPGTAWLLVEEPSEAAAPLSGLAPYRIL